MSSLDISGGGWPGGLDGGGEVLDSMMDVYVCFSGFKKDSGSAEI